MKGLQLSALVVIRALNFSVVARQTTSKTFTEVRAAR